MTDQWPSLDEMRDWAGERAFERGSRYFFEGRVQVERISDGTIRGEAHGTDAYALWLKQKDGEWRWHCECPAAEGGAFCKHLIAAVMAAANDAVRKAPMASQLQRSRLLRRSRTSCWRSCARNLRNGWPVGCTNWRRMIAMLKSACSCIARPNSRPC
jgi:uncharacterized Zn finger protein